MSAAPNGSRSASTEAVLEAVLAARARALARPLRPTLGTLDAEARQAIVVRAGASTIAVPLVDVVEILAVGRVTPLPGATAPVVGVVAWRGRVLAAHALGPLASNGAMATHPVIVVGDARTPIALVVDAIDDIRSITAALAADGSEHPATDLPTLGITSDAIAVLDVPALRRRVADAATDES